MNPGGLQQVVDILNTKSYNKRIADGNRKKEVFPNVSQFIVSKAGDIASRRTDLGSCLLPWSRSCWEPGRRCRWRRRSHHLTEIYKQSIDFYFESTTKIELIEVLCTIKGKNHRATRAGWLAGKIKCDSDSYSEKKISRKARVSCSINIKTLMMRM